TCLRRFHISPLTFRLLAFPLLLALSVPCILFVLTDSSPTEIYTLSLHDALPIWRPTPSTSPPMRTAKARPSPGTCWRPSSRCQRSEEHTSELQSRFDLVCRLLLEKKKQGYIIKH